MAKRNHTRDPRTPTTSDEQTQRLTVSFYQDGNPETLWIRLHGPDLRQACFTPDAPVRVRVVPGCLLVTSN